jgi:hypothetical protein
LSKRIRLSKQILDIWQRSVQSDASPWTLFATTAAALVLHLGALSLTHRIENASTQSSPQQQSVRVELRPTKAVSQSVEQPAQKAKVKEVPVNKKRTLTVERSTGTNKPIEVVPSEFAPTQPDQRTPAQSSLPEERQSPILPSGKFDFIEKQRNIGDAIGAGAVAGDLEIPDIVSEQTENTGVRATEYTFAGYFNSLSRRFVEAWGGVRTLPPTAQFDGKLGEFIEYDVVINRDGSLRKIVNVTAKREPYRDFSAVDELVIDVFRAMFPFQPVPERIKNDPLVVRKRIQFVGFKYTLY